MKKRGGVLYELADGRMAIAYNCDQAAVKEDCRLLKQVDKDMKPVLSEHNGRQAILIKNLSDLTVRGYVD